MTLVSKNVYIDKLCDIVDEYIIEKLRWNLLMLKIIYIDFEKEVNDKDPKFKVGDYVGISKYKNMFAKGYMPNWSGEVFVIKKVKNTVPWTYIINNFNGFKIWFKKWKLSVQAEMKYIDLFRYVELFGGVHFFRFRSETPLKYIFWKIWSKASKLSV